MKKKLLYVISSVFLFAVLAFADDKQSTSPAAGPPKAAPARIAKMNVMGKVIGISEKSVKIERKVKDKIELMEFSLEKPVENIAVNDEVKIAYLEKEGSLLAVRVAKIIHKKSPRKDFVDEKSLAPQK